MIAPTVSNDTFSKFDFFDSLKGGLKTCPYGLFGYRCRGGSLTLPAALGMEFAGTNAKTYCADTSSAPAGHLLIKEKAFCEVEKSKEINEKYKVKTTISCDYLTKR